jgi:hypothetical protein
VSYDEVRTDLCGAVFTLWLWEDVRRKLYSVKTSIANFVEFPETSRTTCEVVVYLAECLVVL